MAPEPLYQAGAIRSIRRQLDADPSRPAGQKAVRTHPRLRQGAVKDADSAMELAGLEPATSWVR
jgi:hypothetical protein